MKRNQLFAALLAAFSTLALANPPGSGTENGNGCLENCGASPSGNGGLGGAATGGTSSATGISGSTALGGSATGTSTASTSSTSSNSFGNSRTYALGAAAIGSPANDTCVAYVSVAWGAVTLPKTIPSCVALAEASFLVHLGLTDAAIDRLCQLESIAATRACPQKAPLGD